MWKLMSVGDDPKHLCPATIDGQSILTVTYEGNTPFAAVYDVATAYLVGAAPQLLDLVREYRRVAEYHGRIDLAYGDDEGANLKRITVSRIDDVLRLVGGIATPGTSVLPPVAPTPVVEFLIEVAAEIERAAVLHPGPNPNLAALTEEVGEVAKALLEARESALAVGEIAPFQWDAIREEAVQVAAMAFRIVFEGDPSMSVVPE